MLDPRAQSLVLSYKGPDTLGGVDATLDDGNPVVALNGLYQAPTRLRAQRYARARASARDRAGQDAEP